MHTRTDTHTHTQHKLHLVNYTLPLYKQDLVKFYNPGS